MAGVRRRRVSAGCPGPRGFVLPFVLCLACSAPGTPGGTAASTVLLGGAEVCGATAAGAPAAAAEPGREDERRRCRGGRDAVAFGRKLIEYGLATLEYAVGLLLIALGALFVAMGWLISALELLWC